SPRGRFGLAFDKARNLTTLFGGSTGGGQYFNDTWFLNGDAWAVRPPGPSPVGPGQFGMAFDSRRAKTVMFGGASIGGTLFSETWEFDGVQNQWSSPTNSGPSPRFAVQLAFDSTRGRIVLFGGEVAGGGFAGDTWEYHTRGATCTT